MRRFAHLASFVLALALLSGCPETTNCPEGEIRIDDACASRDGAVVDAPSDGGGDGDAGPCGPCTGTTPICVVEGDGSAACRECGADRHCTEAGASFCDPATRTCVECLSDAQCTSADRAQCAGGECVPCTSPAHCGGRMFGGESLPVCDTSRGDGVCVGCTVATEEDDCGLDACDPVTRRCSGLRRGSAVVCGECVSDSHCAENHLCVELRFGGVVQGNYCLGDSGALGGCNPPYSEPLMRTTRSGVTGRTVCGVLETLTSCAAINEFTETCSGAPTDCGGAAGAICGTVGGVANRCTYGCRDMLDCFPSRACGATTRYCGGS